MVRCEQQLFRLPSRWCFQPEINNPGSASLLGPLSSNCLPTHIWKVMAFSWGILNCIISTEYQAKDDNENNKQFSKQLVQQECDTFYVSVFFFPKKSILTVRRLLPVNWNIHSLMKAIQTQEVNGKYWNSWVSPSLPLPRRYTQTVAACSCRLGLGVGC